MLKQHVADAVSRLPYLASVTRMMMVIDARAHCVDDCCSAC